MQLPSGEVINGDVPAGLSDDDVKSYVRMKRPDLFGAPAPAAGGALAGTAARGQTSPQAAAGMQIQEQPMNPASTYTGPGAWPNPQAAAQAGGSSGYRGAVAGPLGAAATVMGGPPVVGAALPFLKQAGKALPAIAASEAINYARQNIPGGKYIPPGAEMLPLFMAGGKGEPEAAPEAATPPKGAAALGRLPFARAGAPEPAPMPPTKLPFLRGEPQYPPPEPTGAYDKPVKASNSLSDTLDDQAVREQVQGRIEQSDRKWQAEQGRRDWNANTVNRNKGDMVQDAGGTVPQKPVKFTKTPPLTARPSTPAATPETDDLTPLLQKSLDAVRQRKK